ncbi:MAG: type II toxin-antitoxin system HicA family toxin [bacterium]|nr:addiction module toxin, HicA family [Bacillota bacterium]
MSRLTIVSSKGMAKILEILGFKEIRQKGSHKIYRHKDGRTTVIPFHDEDLQNEFRKGLSPLCGEGGEKRAYQRGSR